jgi:hypothetical protein
MDRPFELGWGKCIAVALAEIVHDGQMASSQVSINVSVS